MIALKKREKLRSIRAMKPESRVIKERELLALIIPKIRRRGKTKLGLRSRKISTVRGIKLKKIVRRVIEKAMRKRRHDKRRTILQRKKEIIF